jgi:hypothetical protein
MPASPRRKMHRDHEKKFASDVARYEAKRVRREKELEAQAQVLQEKTTNG